MRKLVPRVCLAAAAGESTQLMSGGRPVDWVCVDDVVDGLLRRLAAGPEDGGYVDLGGGILTTTGEVAERPLEQARVADVAATRSLLGWAPGAGLDDGPRRTYDWYREARRACRGRGRIHGRRGWTRRENRMKTWPLRALAESEGAGERIYALAERLYPVCLSSTGDGVRQSLAAVRDHIPLDRHEVPPRTAVFDWTVPKEWNVREAWIRGPDGDRSWTSPTPISTRRLPRSRAACRTRSFPARSSKFDEYLNYPGWREHEYRAFKECVAAKGLRYEQIGYARAFSVALQIN